MDTTKLKQFISKTPDNPGIYRFQNAQKKDIYIGKASSIKKRLTSYTLALRNSNGKTADPRIQKMIATAKHLTHIKTDSDIEALILESQLIKQRHPQFNIMLRDDKQYFFVGFTDDEFPRIFLTHQLGSHESRIRKHESGKNRWPNSKFLIPNSSFIGPFTDGAALKTTLKYLRNIFPYCTCKQKHHNFCLNYHIGKCPGVCCLKQPDAISNLQLSISNYKQNIKAIKDILNGRRTSLVKKLKREMETAGKKHNFYEAIKLRNKLERLERVFKNARVIKSSSILKKHAPFLSGILHNTKPITHIEGYDVSNIQGAHATGAMVTFVDGVPNKNYYRHFKIRANKSKNKPLLNPYDRNNLAIKANDTAMLYEILKRRFSHPEWPFPDLILIDGGKGQLNAALTALIESGITNYESRIIALSKDDRHKGRQIFIPNRKQPILLSKLNLTDKNLLLSIDEESHRFAISHYRYLHRKLLK